MSRRNLCLSREDSTQWCQSSTLVHCSVAAGLLSRVDAIFNRCDESSRWGRSTRSAGGERSALRPWLARSNTGSPQSSECAASRSSTSRLHYRTVVSACDPTTAIVLCTRVRWWRRRLLLRRLRFETRLLEVLERRDVHRKSLFLFTVRKRRGQVPAPNGRRRRRRSTNFGDSSKADACDDDGRATCRSKADARNRCDCHGRCSRSTGCRRRPTTATTSTGERRRRQMPAASTNVEHG